MTRFRYTPKMLAFLEAGYRDMQVPELTEAFNRAFGARKTEQQIKCCLSNHRFTCGRPTGSVKGAYRLFTSVQADFIRDGYKAMSLADLTDQTNAKFGTAFTVQQIRTFTRNHAIKSGRTGQFDKGHTPWNAGRKGWQAGGRSADTRFKKGRPPQESRNYKPIGSTRISKDGYIERKVTDDHPVPARRWVGEHRLVWEAANGPIPDGHVVVFLDGDKLNVNLDNLRCVPRGVLATLNKLGMNETSGEARKAAILTAEVMNKASTLEREAS